MRKASCWTTRFEPEKQDQNLVVLPLHHSPIFPQKSDATDIISVGLPGFGNLEKQDQNLLCYHYTIAHCPFATAKFSDLFLNPQILFLFS